MEPKLKQYLGKKITLTDGKTVKIEHITGNRFKQNFYEINGQHLIGMLRFHKIMGKVPDKEISEQDCVDFENMELFIETNNQKTFRQNEMRQQDEARKEAEDIRTVKPRGLEFS